MKVVYNWVNTHKYLVINSIVAYRQNSIVFTKQSGPETTSMYPLFCHLNVSFIIGQIISQIALTVIFLAGTQQFSAH